MKIYAPVKDACGVYASVVFVNGVGQTDNPALLSWFTTHGYQVGDNAPVDGTPVASMPSAPQRLIDKLADLNLADIKKWAKDNGHYELIKDIRGKKEALQVLAKVQ